MKLSKKGMIRHLRKVLKKRNDKASEEGAKLESESDLVKL